MRILYIEDEIALLEVVKRACQSCRKIDSATTLAEAKARLASDTYDVLLVDLNLPDSQGVDTVESLKPYCLPIIVVTGDATPEYEASCRELGVDDFMRKTDIVKPDFTARIRAVYDAHLSKWRKTCNLAFDNFDALKPYLSTATAFASLALIANPRR